ncbi:hypothetical protein AU468_12250 [Alkalispirochaeta sphaeroplastigenens]|uniref:Uncharacterized protein n=1 Tax=Alkalispirochaeta sphaeroplastigenens TaxID=1187066 RepID=A0A2S4JGW4_9SPIO|nr:MULTISPECIES: PG0541 family transporter-associated protein [Alkalispirochaeta]POQ98804.1 hypothetical protein AU468_12250 [Alkalispirochaeta sphaeroplastigenens]
MSETRNCLRVEIILNQAVEEDLLERFQTHRAGRAFTRLCPVFGRGSSGERRGDQVWPEENVLILIYCDRDEKDRLVRAVREVKGLYPDEGIKLFASAVDLQEV